MPAHWLLTSTFYGNHLPGSTAGFVGSVRDRRPTDSPTGSRIEHAVPGSPVDADLPGLWRASRDRMKGDPVRVNAEQAAVLLAQFRETAAVRGWALLAVAIMADHVHLVVAAPPDSDPGTVLGDFKAYGARALNRRYGKPPSGTWWTSRGSTRKKNDPAAIAEAVAYVLYRQTGPLVTWSPTAHEPSEPSEPSALADGVTGATGATGGMSDSEPPA